MSVRIPNGLEKCHSFYIETKSLNHFVFNSTFLVFSVFPNVLMFGVDALYVEMTPRCLAGFIAVGFHRFSRLARGSHPPSTPVSGASFHAGLVSPPTGLPGLPVSSSGVLLGHIGGGGHNEG